METMQTEQYAPRPYRFSRYDKRLILKVVQEVEEGLPRKEAIRIYGLGPSIIREWPMVSHITNNILKETVTAIFKSAPL